MTPAEIAKAPSIAAGGGANGSRETVWLRSNLRPVAAIATVAALVCGLLSGAVSALDAPDPLRRSVAVACVVAAAVVAVLAAVAGRPRLAHRGDALRVRLTPTGVEDVPLDVVECFFLGSSDLDDAATRQPDESGRRVTTLVVRLAERAVEWRERPSFAAWGAWKEGAIVLDGRWCEPLSVEVARHLSSRLIEAKRAGAAGRADPQAAAKQSSGAAK